MIRSLHLWMTTLAVCFLLPACAAAQVFARPAAAPSPLASNPTATRTTISATPSPLPIATPTLENKTYDYKVIHQDGGFIIREAFLGTNAIWKDDFQAPGSRIENTVASLGLGRDMTCASQPGSATPCSQKLDLTLANGATDSYQFRLAGPDGGAGVLIKNGRLLWSGQTNGAASFAVVSSRQIGDEIAFDYLKSNWGSGDPRVWVSDSILLTKGKTVVLLPESFAPYPIQGRLIYFKIKGRKETLVFDGKEVGGQYDDVIDRLCCWKGPSIEISANGEMIDFFAQKGPDWYHVQAGYPQRTK